MRLVYISLFFLLWLVRCQTARPVDLKEGIEIRVRGVLTEEPIVFGQTQSFSLQGVKIKTPRFPEYHYSDRLIITGRVKVRVINRFYKQYTLIYPEIEAQGLRDKEKGILSFIFKLRKKIEEIYDQTLPEPQASLLAGIVLGSKRRISDRFFQALKKTGTLHVVVASGANISLVSQPLLENLSGFLSRKIALLITFVLMWFYTIMAGFDPPVVRAALMASFAFLAQFLGRERDVVRSLLLAAGLMLLIDPLIVFDLGFQLSFSATAGILLFYEKIKPFFSRLSFFGDGLATTLAAQVFVLPIIFLNFKEISLISPLVNALVLWTIDPLMKLGGVMAAFGILSRLLGQILAYPAWLLLTFFVKVIEIWA